MPSFPSHVPRIVVRAEYLIAELALADSRMLLTAGVALLHRDHYPIVKRSAIKVPSKLQNSNGTAVRRVSYDK